MPEAPNSQHARLEGTLLRFYPQDILVTTDQTALLAKVETCRIPQKINDGPADHEMITIGQHGEKVKISQIDSLQLFSPEFDMVHTFTAAKLTANMWRDTLETLTKTFPQDSKLVQAAKYWDTMPHGRLRISPRGMVEQNAYYSRISSGGCELKFGHFTVGSDEIFTCRTPDIVAHEAGHYSLDRVRPQFNETNNLQTGGLHEAFGDITALSFVLADDPMARALINSTNGNLHASNNFASQLAEEFGISLGMHGHLRNADDDYKMSEVLEEVHAISEVFTGAYYDALVSAFNEATRTYPEINAVNLLQAVGEYGRNLILHAIVTVPEDAPEFVDVANQLQKVIGQHAQTAPARVQYLNKLKWKEYFANEFARREVSVPANEIRHVPKQKMQLAALEKTKYWGKILLTGIRANR